MNVTMNQYAADAVFMEMIHQESVTQRSTWMDDVFCSESCCTVNTGSCAWCLHPPCVFAEFFGWNLWGLFLPLANEPRWSLHVALFLIPFWAWEDPSSAFPLFCCHPHLWIMGVGWNAGRFQELVCTEINILIPAESSQDGSRISLCLPSVLHYLMPKCVSFIRKV